MTVTVYCTLGLEKVMHQFPEYVHILYVCGILKKKQSQPDLVLHSAKLAW